ncbi:hypothetical protein [Pseudomonas sp. R5(2019)]|uniref:hypothetical protein n=1 Tax=Pseudomonas sp. R5(2019) TaxID=2697566 RepID=UPI001C499E0D|nr:hypothetical protein [Pseudomonas sp. R5(2019)]NBA96391.1 hypothetical protein [Pseudomonas sp. R5(2019)]
MEFDWGCTLMQDSRFAQGFRTLGAGLAALSLAALMSGCVSSEGKPANDVPIEKETSAVPMATPPQVYAKEIGSARFERSGIKEVQGYTVESGNLLTKDGDTGSLVVVRAPDNSVVAIIDEPGNRGILLVNRNGERTFHPEPPLNYMTADTVPGAEELRLAAPPPSSGEHKYVDMLVGYTNYTLGQLGGDAVGYALAQLETLNLGLRNSLVSGLSLRLVGIKIIDETPDYGTSSEGLRNWQNNLQNDKVALHADVSTSYGSGNGPGGRAYMPGHTSVNLWYAPSAFRHEISHNAGGDHCNGDPDSKNYKYGYSNGRSATFLCGNNVPYVSTPAVRDAHGLPLGNANTADMARVWRENIARLTGYQPELPGERLILAGLGEQETARLRMDTSVANPRAGLVALDPSVGPTQLQALPGGGYTTLTVKLKNDAGVEFPVKLRAQRSIGGCSQSGMNNNAGCQGGGALFFTLQYLATDNPQIPEGMFNGVLKLKAIDAAAPNWETPVTISISIRQTKLPKVRFLSENYCLLDEGVLAVKIVTGAACHGADPSAHWTVLPNGTIARGDLFVVRAGDKAVLGTPSTATPALKVDFSSSPPTIKQDDTCLTAGAASFGSKPLSLARCGMNGQKWDYVPIPNQ